MGARARGWVAANGGAALNVLSLSATALPIGVPVVVRIIGATATSAITATGVPAGLTLNGAARTIIGTPTAATRSVIELTETLAGKAGSPKKTSVAIDVINPVTPPIVENSVEKAETGNLASRRLVSLGELGKFSSALARVRNRTGRAKIGFIGDSTTAGFGAAVTAGTGGGTGAGAAGNFLRANSMPQQLAAMLQAAGIPTRSDAIFGNGNGAANTVAEYASVDPGNVFGGDWSINVIGSLGGGAFAESNTGTTSFSTRPWQYAADTFEIYYATLNSFGQFTVTDASGTLATVDSTIVSLPAGAGAGGFGRVTVSRALASKLPISIQRTGGGQIFIIGIVPFDTNNPRVEIWNMGWGGSKTADWALQGSNGWKAYYAIGLIDQPDLWHAELGLNDQNTAVASATFQANLASIVARAKIGGADVILGKPHRPYLDNAAWLLSAAHFAAIEAAAAAAGALAIVDYSALPLVQTDYFDAPHLSRPGYAKKAALLRELVLSKA